MLEDCFLERHSPDVEAGAAPLLTPSGLLAEMRCAPRGRRARRRAPARAQPAALQCCPAGGPARPVQPPIRQDTKQRSPCRTFAIKHPSLRR